MYNFSICFNHFFENQRFRPMHPSKSTSRRHCIFFCCFIKKSSKLNSRLHQRPEMRFKPFAKKSKLFIEKSSKSSSRLHESSIFAMLRVCKKMFKKTRFFWNIAFYNGKTHISAAGSHQNGKKMTPGGTPPLPSEPAAPKMNPKASKRNTFLAAAFHFLVTFWWALVWFSFNIPYKR